MSREAELDDSIGQLRQAMADLQSGETSSDLFGSQTPAVGEPDEPAPAEPSGRGESDEYAAARAVVLRKLTGSPKSRHQLTRTLREREVSEEVITAVLDRLEEVQLIDDAAFARTWVRTRHELKALGAAALRRELKDKGISPEHIEQALEQVTAEDEDAAARQLLQAKLSGVTVPAGPGAEERAEREKITRRLVGMLARRGHRPGAALRLVREELETRSV